MVRCLRVLEDKKRSLLTVPIATAVWLVLASAGPLVAQQCLDPTRTLIGNGPGSAGCRSFDGDQANCEASYIIGGTGPTSCYFDAQGDCLGCGPNNEGPDCINTCQPAPVCNGDPGRTNFLGGSGNEACRQFDGDAEQCNTAFHRGGDGEFASCFVTQHCDACGDDDSGFCINSCVPPPICADQTRTTFAGGPGTNACEQFDGDETACNQAFHLGGDGVASCFYDTNNDSCRGCGLNNERSGNCTNTCATTPTCVDATRTDFVGGPGTEACHVYDGDQTSCEAAYHREGRNGRAASCYYDTDSDSCLGCGPNHEGNGDCVNTCTVPATCIDASRTIYTGPPGSEGCTRFNGDQTSCEDAYVEGDGGVASCYYDTNNNQCRGCGGNNEGNGACTNTCITTPTCALDASRTIYTGGPGSEGCRQFDNDQTQCVQAFTRGEGGVASCFFGADGDCRGCGPENVNDGVCVNSCKTQPICGSDPNRTALGCGRFDNDPAGCATAYGLLDDGSPTSCVVADLCLGCGPNNAQQGLCTNECAQAELAAPAVSWNVLIAVILTLFGIGFYQMRRRV